MGGCHDVPDHIILIATSVLHGHNKSKSHLPREEPVSERSSALDSSLSGNHARQRFHEFRISHFAMLHR